MLRLDSAGIGLLTPGRGELVLTCPISKHRDYLPEDRHFLAGQTAEAMFGKTYNVGRQHAELWELTVNGVRIVDYQDRASTLFSMWRNRPDLTGLVLIMAMNFAWSVRARIRASFSAWARRPAR